MHLFNELFSGDSSFDDGPPLEGRVDGLHLPIKREIEMCDNEWTEGSRYQEFPPNGLVQRGEASSVVLNPTVGFPKDTQGRPHQEKIPAKDMNDPVNGGHAHDILLRERDGGHGGVPQLFSRWPQSTLIPVEHDPGDLPPLLCCRLPLAFLRDPAMGEVDWLSLGKDLVNNFGPHNTDNIEVVDYHPGQEVLGRLLGA